MSDTRVGIEYDKATKELLRTVQRADALRGPRGDVNLQASAAAGIEAAGHSGGTAGILGMGIAAGSVGLSEMMQATSTLEGASPSSGRDLVATLEALKNALDAGLIDQSDYDAAKAKVLDLA
jgi:membrane protease subunit (stomatin/prohibitin family)